MRSPCSPTDLQRETAATAGGTVIYTVVRPDPLQDPTQRIEFPITPAQSAGRTGLAGRQHRHGRATGDRVGSGVGRRARTGDVIATTFLVPAKLIREGRPIGDAGFMGPVGIAVTTGDVVRSAREMTAGRSSGVMALLSAAFGITNLLPIPALDGGRLVFVLLEAVAANGLSRPRKAWCTLLAWACCCCWSV